MAIQFFKEPTGPVIPMYNNMIYEFYSDIGDGVRATVKISSYTFEISGNKGLFHFNAKDVFNVLMNKFGFRDDIIVELPQNFVQPDFNLWNSYDINFKIFQLNGASDSLDKPCAISKAVVQLYDPTYEEAEKIRIYLPSNDTLKHATFFEGYPFDVPVYSNIARTVTVTNKKTSSSILIQLAKGVNRVFISSGPNESQGFESLMPLYLGKNELEFSFTEGSVSEKANIIIDKKPVDCGTYLKWFNASGAWSYWKFSPVYSKKVNTKILDEINNDFSNVDKTVSPTIVTGIQTKPEMSLNSGYLNVDEQRLVSDLFTSPKVFIYTNEIHQKFFEEDFKEVQVKPGSREVFNSKLETREFQVDIMLAEQYRQTYAG
ncbi:hypothetical protein [Aquimarina intermedia]|uniref:Uncharacterized protein n=1 Tax=Aquimarina intermedia TaxID=350814 RepID=A0A5S5BZ59_9FLAO|nr:hypothetical protein [Aquimarina intermedia]TYP71492.1 hypothetical protein BD809_10974 [Aquimarina intermedia]